MATAPALRPDVRALLWPLTEDEFLARYWERQHAYTKGTPERLDVLRSAFGGFEPADLLAWRKGDVVASAKPVGRGQENVIVPTTAEALARFDAGETLVFNLDTTSERLKPWYDAFTGYFSPQQNRSVVTAFCSPPGHGTSMHFDRHDVFNVPLTGTKTWRVAPGADNTLHDWQVEAPIGRELSSYWSVVPGQEVPTDVDTLDMSPGSIAYLPRGYFHETLASDEPSIGISFIIDVMSMFELLSNALRAAMVRSPLMRASANDLWHGRNGTRESLVAGLAELQALAATLRPEDIAPPPPSASVHEHTRLRQSALALRALDRVAGEDKLVVRRIDQTDAAHIDPEDGMILDWIDQQRGAFAPADAYPRFEAEYGRPALDQMFATLVETGYLTYAPAVFHG